jgi:hypothetical protein
LLSCIAQEIFITGGAIGAQYPNLVPETFRQLSDEPEMMMRETRNMVETVLRIPDLALETLPSRMTAGATRNLVEKRLSHRLMEWDDSVLKSLTVMSFWPGCVLGAEHPQLFWNALRASIRKGLEGGRLPLWVALKALYTPCLSEESKEMLDQLREPLQNMDDTSDLDSWQQFYEKMARDVLLSYECECGRLQA